MTSLGDGAGFGLPLIGPRETQKKDTEEASALTVKEPEEIEEASGSTDKAGGISAKAPDKAKVDINDAKVDPNAEKKGGSGGSDSGTDEKDDKDDKKPQKEPEVEYELIELVEGVKQSQDKFVKGPGMDTSETSIFKANVSRTDKDASNYKQYINLSQDLEGQDKRHPEYGRIIRFRARVKQKDGKTDKLSGVSVVFSFARTDGVNRKDAGGSEPACWDGADLSGSQKEGFGSAGGATTKTVTTDAKGWTSEVSFYVSEFAGDQFEISCKLKDGTAGADGAQPLKTSAKYVVWRKFWYQLTHADGYNAPQPTKAESAFAEVFAEMVKVNTKKFTRDDFPADLKDRTFYKEYMLSSGGADKTVANVGDSSNIAEFRTNAKLKMTTEADHPVKENLIACEYQCDPQGRSQLKVYKLTSANQTITIAKGNGGSIVCKPPIKAGAKLVSAGEWSKAETPWSKEGNITDDHIEIDSSRTSTLQVKIKLPADAPTPTVADPVYVRLQVETAASFLGWATSSGIVAVYRPAAAAGAQGSEADFNDTAAHEFGHKFNQTPKPSKEPSSLKAHPLQYVGHGGSGSHCRHGATVAPGAVNWQDASEKTPSPSDGDCIMYHRYSSACSHSFCVVCKSYLQLQKMDSF
ncbi:hypothetical protein OLMES_4840 [Oleiphilus messinensis]|uniref:Uncharacterized protein n=1 Tax=Oleiphilus messinensis TaxID=141451 RepID=A0A1Y0IE71_9GAMM|nr:hypothetical protein [Oleiphilus messinensis]ARU58828.1 hypothetical protein OLMES_4840 [Oleiphilus messinensis]